MRIEHLFRFVTVGLARAIPLSGSVVCALAINILYGSEELGRFSIALSAALFLALLYRGGTPRLILRAFASPDNSEDRTSIYWSYIAYQIYRPLPWILFVLGLAATLLFLDWIEAEISRRYFLWLLPVSFVGMLLQLTAGYLNIQGQVRRAALLDFGLSNAVILVLILLCWGFLNQQDLTLALMIFGLLTIIGGGGFVLLNNSRLSSPAHVAASDTTRLMLNALLEFVNKNGYPLIFAAFMTTQDVGEIRLEGQLCLIIAIGHSILQTLFARQIIKAVRDKTPNLKRMMLERFAIATCMLLASATILWVLLRVPALESALNLTAGTDHIGWMLLGSIFFSLGNLTLFFLNANGKFNWMIVQTAVAGIVFIGLSYGLYPEWGLQGVRYAYVFGGSLSLLVGVGFCAAVVRQ